VGHGLEPLGHFLGELFAGQDEAADALDAVCIVGTNPPIAASASSHLSMRLPTETRPRSPDNSALGRLANGPPESKSVRSWPMLLDEW
jgi:hypothetical protein